MSRVKFGFITAMAILLSACTLLDPFIDRRRNAGVSDPALLYTGKSKPAEPAVCYNAWTTSYAEVKKLADEECGKHKTGNYAIPTKMTTFSCKLLIPNHVYFKCVP